MDLIKMFVLIIFPILVLGCDEEQQLPDPIVYEEPDIYTDEQQAIMAQLVADHEEMGDPVSELSVMLQDFLKERELTSKLKMICIQRNEANADSFGLFDVYLRMEIGDNSYSEADCLAVANKLYMEGAYCVRSEYFGLTKEYFVYDFLEHSSGFSETDEECQDSLGSLTVRSKYTDRKKQFEM